MSSSWCSSTTAARDRTPELLDHIAETDPRGEIHLSRNFGHQAALTAGLEHAVGDVVAMIDADLQDPPELIPDMVAQWSQGSDVVYAVRRQREGETAFKLATASWFYKLFDKLGAGRPQAELGRLPPARPPCGGPVAGDDRALALPAGDDRVGGVHPEAPSPISATRDTPARPSTRCARCCGSRWTRSRRSRTCRCSWPPTWDCCPPASRSSRSPSSSACTSPAPTCRLRLDHDRDPAARRHPADRARRDRRVRRAHLRRGQAPAAVHRARGAQPPERQRAHRRDADRPSGTARPRARAACCSKAVTQAISDQLLREAPAVL